MKTPEPTRIIQAPFSATGRKRDGLTIYCDNGQRYTLKQLGKFVGMAGPSFSRRLEKEGWDSEYILRKKGELIPKVEAEIADIPCDIDVSTLGDKARTEKLKDIPSFTPYEMKLFRKSHERRFGNESARP